MSETSLDNTPPDISEKKSRKLHEKAYQDFINWKLAKHRDVACNATFDGYLCWPPTKAGEVASQNCPPARLSDTTKMAFRICDNSGLWQGRKLNETSAVGWTNYTPCYPPEVRLLFGKVYNDEEDAQNKFFVAQTTRYMEIAGFAISLIALSISLFIFTYFRSLRNNRTRIHKSLFVAMLAQVLIRLTVYLDQALVRHGIGDHSTYEDAPMRGIDNMPYVCEGAYVLLEYAISVMFMWMFLEGLYLHKVVTGNALRENVSYKLYYFTGWGLPVLNTAMWAALTAMHYENETVKTCWYGYNFSLLYWVLQGPRLAVIVINLVFLLNIMRVLIVKLRKTESNELDKVRKAARAALVLLPLLGITNALNMIEAPLDGNLIQFAIWSYVTHFLRAFQGFFIALIYCFMNGEVRQVLRKQYDNHMAMRVNRRNRPNRPNRVPRDSLHCSGVNKRYRKNRAEELNEIPLRELSWISPSSTNRPDLNNDIQIESVEEMHAPSSTYADGQSAETNVRIEETEQM